MVLSYGWNQSRFSIKPRWESATSLLKKFGESSLSDSLKFFHTCPSYISVKILSKFDRLAQCRREFSNPGRQNIVASCWLIPANGYIKLGRIIVRFVDTLIFSDNAVLQRRDLQTEELGNSMCWHFIIAGLSSYLNLPLPVFIQFVIFQTRYKTMKLVI